MSHWWAPVRLWTKLIDWASDPRLPHHLPLQLLRRVASRRLIKRGYALPQRPVSVCLTVDVETDDCRPFEGDNGRAASAFMPAFKALCESEGWRVTFFVQGDLVHPLEGQLAALADRHELGLHGYHHELWGRPLWYGQSERTTSASDRKRLLERARRGFAESGLPVPTSFRAPYLLADRQTLQLLRDEGFELDSSAMSPRCESPLPHFREGLFRIPVSVSPEPHFVRRFGLPVFGPYRVLNMENLVWRAEGLALRLAQDIVAFQLAVGWAPHLVVLAHPWEFEGGAEHTAAHRGTYGLLVSRMRALAAAMEVAWLPLAELRQRLQPVPLVRGEVEIDGVR